MYPGAMLTPPRHSPSSLILFLLGFFPPLSSPSFFTSCTHLTGVQPWNGNSAGSHLRSWLRSGVSVVEDNDDKIESRLYDPADDKFVAHVAGWNDRVEYDEDGEESEENRRVVTIARLSFFLIPIPH